MGRRRVADRKVTFVFLGKSVLVHVVKQKRGRFGAHKRGSKSTPTFATECENYRGFERLGEKIVREVVAGPQSA